MDNTTTWKLLDKRIRSSLAYTNWANRKKGVACLKCGSIEELECHHLIDLYHVILDLWKFYGEPEAVFQHIIGYHENDMLEGVTMCKTCHKIRHPGRVLSAAANDFNTDTWSVIPRMLKLKLTHSNKNRDQDSIGLIAYQTIFGIGWHILNGHVESRILTIHRRRFAQLIDKTPSVSFNNSLDDALIRLQNIGILCGVHRQDNDIELHLSNEYLELMEKNPWFVPRNDILTDSMCVLCLRLWLGMQSKRHNYSIGLDKLKIHIGMNIKSKYDAMIAINKALIQIDWAKMEVDDYLRFKLSSRPPTPIRGLRAVLTDALEQAK